jgi:Xaa-Pro aminopeptidase
MDYRRYRELLSKQRFSKEMAFTEAEYRSRVAKVRGFMAERNLDALLVTFLPNVCYLTGFHAFAADLFACFLLTMDGEPTLQVAEFEISGAMLSGWVEDVRPAKFANPESASIELSEIVKEKKLDGKRIGIETKFAGLSVGLYESLKAILPGASFVEASDVVFQARMVKSPAELDHMRTAATIAKKGIEDTVNAVRPGVTENDLASVAYATAVKEGSEYFSCQPVVVGAHRTGWIHTSHRGARIEAGHTVTIEVGAFYHRYMSAIMHTVVLGEPSKTVERFAKASNDTIDLILETVRPGRTAHEVAIAAKKGIAGVADEAYSTGMFGYSVGLSLPPTWREGLIVLAEGNHRPLEAGMTFLSPITLRDPGVMGVGFSETYVLTETGCEVLTAHDRSLTVVR